MANGNGNGMLWKFVASNLIAVVLTGIGSYIVMGNKPTEPKVKELIAQEAVQPEEMREFVRDHVDNRAPYVLERGALVQSIDSNASAIGEVKLAVEKLLNAQQAQVIEQRVFMAQIKSYIEKQENK